MFMLGMESLTCNISTWELEAGDPEFLASLGNTVKPCALVSSFVNLTQTRVIWEEWPQLRNCLDQTGLRTRLRVIFLTANWCGRASSP